MSESDPTEARASRRPTESKLNQGWLYLSSATRDCYPILGSIRVASGLVTRPESLKSEPALTVLLLLISVFRCMVSSLPFLTGCYRPRAEVLSCFLLSFSTLRQSQYRSCTAFLQLLPLLGPTLLGHRYPVLPSCPISKSRRNGPELRPAIPERIGALNSEVYLLHGKGFGHLSCLSPLAWDRTTLYPAGITSNERTSQTLFGVVSLTSIATQHGPLTWNWFCVLLSLSIFCIWSFPHRSG